MALIPARDRPEHRASSSWDHPLCRRRLRTRFSNEGKFAMIVSAYAMISSFNSHNMSYLLESFWVRQAHLFRIVAEITALDQHPERGRTPRSTLHCWSLRSVTRIRAEWAERPPIAVVAPRPPALHRMSSSSLEFLEKKRLRI